ncbi:MAG: hypothetical protein IJ412_11350 [Oscillospiraceae bacterium]|nr:hypothetical protein [Oscillospiraceae bacterium]
MRNYESECMKCGAKRQLAFKAEPYPEIGDIFLRHCPICDEETQHTRILTRKAAAELRRRQEEADLRSSIVEKSAEYGFKCRFLYQSVIITTNLADWCFDYHKSKITLYHESTIKVNFETGNYAKSHVQFANKKMAPLDVISYIANHDAWRTQKLNR